MDAVNRFEEDDSGRFEDYLLQLLMEYKSSCNSKAQKKSKGKAREQEDEGEDMIEAMDDDMAEGMVWNDDDIDEYNGVYEDVATSAQAVGLRVMGASKVNQLGRQSSGKSIVNNARMRAQVDRENEVPTESGRRSKRNGKVVYYSIAGYFAEHDPADFEEDE